MNHINFINKIMILVNFEKLWNLKFTKTLLFPLACITTCRFKRFTNLSHDAPVNRKNEKILDSWLTTIRVKNLVSPRQRFLLIQCTSFCPNFWPAHQVLSLIPEHMFQHDTHHEMTYEEKGNWVVENWERNIIVFKLEILPLIRSTSSAEASFAAFSVIRI